MAMSPRKKLNIHISDDGVGFAVQKGVQISRSIVRYYKHSDMEDLERVLNEIQDEHIKVYAYIFSIISILTLLFS
jgi:7-keto-8-aminopelargonate synthetase-like enzyme